MIHVRFSDSNAFSAMKKVHPPAAHRLVEWLNIDETTEDAADMDMDLNDLDELEDDIEWNEWNKKI